ncbi:hypothetical protein [Spirosoma pollinicola]|nr:hypothetical protein [Spirosoma pollinicola]
MYRLIITLLILVVGFTVYAQVKTDTAGTDSTKQARHSRKDSIQILDKKMSKNDVIDIGAQLIDESVVA